MGCRIEIEYITNCAVLIQYGAVKILVDGIFSGRQPFDVMDPKTEEQLMEGTGKFKDINYILVTHCHNDHYNGSKIIKFLENHSEAFLVVPENARLDNVHMKRLGDRVFFIKSEENRKKEIHLGNFQLEYMCTGHLTFQYPEHYCLNIIFDAENLLFTADMNLDKLPILSDFTKKEESWIFVNAIVLWHKKWRRYLEALQYQYICFYHLPSEERDQLGYRRKGLIHWQKHKKDFVNGVLLGE